MADGVLIKYSELKAVDDKLKDIIEELENADNRSDQLEAAIGNPWGEDKLRDRAHEFEGGWNDRRKDLTEDLKKIEEHVKAVLDGFQQWDEETSTE
ncbi:MAG: flagellar protein FlgN [Solirubrobacterales bacterium]